MANGTIAVEQQPRRIQQCRCKEGSVGENEQSAGHRNWYVYVSIIFDHLDVK